MKAEKNGIRIILENDLCISCGACTHICPHGNLEMKMQDSRGKWDAFIKNPDICWSCGAASNCLSVCPSYGVNYLELTGSNENHLLGRIKNVYNGYAEDDQLRFAASSGGFIRSLCRTLLENKKIQGAIAVIHEQGLEYNPHIVTNFGIMPNSIYHNVNYQRALDLLQRNSGNYLLIGLPCQITGVELFLRKSGIDLLRKKLYGKVSLICGYTFDQKNIKAFAYYNDFPLREVSYREGGRFRKTRLKNNSSEIMIEAVTSRHFRDLINNMICFDPFIIQTGCLHCVDHLGYCADLVVGDAWQKRYTSDSIGTNIIISRTERGEECISQMHSFHFEEGHQGEIIESQSTNYALGAIGEGMKHLKLKGQYFTPNPKRTDQSGEIIEYQFRLKDLIKIRVIRKLLRKERFRMAKWFYMALEIWGPFFRYLKR